MTHARYGLDFTSSYVPPLRISDLDIFLKWIEIYLHDYCWGNEEQMFWIDISMVNRGDIRMRSKGGCVSCLKGMEWHGSACSGNMSWEKPLWEGTEKRMESRVYYWWWDKLLIWIVSIIKMIYEVYISGNLHEKKNHLKEHFDIHIPENQNCGYIFNNSFPATISIFTEICSSPWGFCTPYQVMMT